ncbi:NifU family protein [Marinicella sp. W31]|uniref:NifU family protein n=1 Tax=Marinicella sp. W31 TaxID=3023713 RepID=UPI003756C5CF
MIEVTSSAQDFLSNILQEQEIDDLHLKVVVLHAGTPAADCQLDFCETEEVQQGYERIALEGFNLYVHEDDQAYFEGAMIDYQIDGASGQLNIKAPLLKGHEPDATASLFDRVQYFLDAEINPKLASHGGHANLADIKEGAAYILFGGGCHGCGMAKQTLSMGMQDQIIARFPEITQVLDATDHATGENPYY